jgi:hypothetical protein
MNVLDMDRKAEGPVIAKARGKFPVTTPPVAMSSLKDDNLCRVRARWDGMNEVNRHGCHMVFDQ